MGSSSGGSASARRDSTAACETSQAAVVRQRQILEAHADNSPLAVIEFDPQFRVTRWAGSAERVFGYSAEEVLGRAITDLRWVYEDDIPLVEHESAQLFDGTKVRGMNTNRNYRKDGSVIWCEWYSSAIHDAEGELVSVLSLVLDVTERKHAEEAARRELENTRVLLDTAAALASGRSLGDVLDAFCDALLVTLPHARVIVSLWDETRRAIVTAASKGQQPVLCGEVLPLEQLTPPGRRVLETRQSAVIDYDLLPLPPGAPPPHRPSHLALAVPLSYGERLVGLFTIDDPDARVAISDREIEIAEGIASQASIAIEHARLYDAERERARFAEALSAIDLAIHASLEWEDIAKRALSESVAAIDADAGVMIGQEGRDLVSWIDYGFTPSILGLRFRDDVGLAEAMESVQQGTVVWEEPRSDERVAPAASAFGVESAIAAPLVVRGETIAALTLVYRTREHRFTEAEVQFVSRVASGLSLALENARLYASERDLADRLQEGMLTLPERVEGVEFAHAYHSAEEAARVGGDFYDLFEVGHDIVGITMGDVAGKGLEAAVLTSLAKNTIRAHASEAGKSTADVLLLTNDVILDATPTESFVTVFFAFLDRRTGRLKYSSAGHTTSVIARGDGTTEPLPATGTILGALPDVEFAEVEVYLEPDDLLFLYTDGLTEARRDGVQYGEERVFETIADGARSPLETVRLIADDVLDYTGGRLSDDLALLALKRLRGEHEAPTAVSLEV